MNQMTNTVQLIGRIGKDVEYRTLDNGNGLAKFSMATNEYYKNSKGEKIQETTWHNITAWGKTAELMKESLHKGIQVLIKGKLVNSSYNDKNGNKVYKTEVVASEFMRFANGEKGSND